MTNTSQFKLATYFVLMFLATPVVAGNSDSKNETGIPAPANINEPPQLSSEVKQLLDGILEIRNSDSLLFDQRGIEEAIKVRLIDRKGTRGFTKFTISGLAPHLSGTYTLRSAFKRSLSAELTIVFNTNKLCAHLPDVLTYLGKPYTRRLALPSPDNAETESKTKPDWPGVSSNVAHVTYHIGGENPSEIQPRLLLSVHDIQCVRIIEVKTALSIGNLSR